MSATNARTGSGVDWQDPTPDDIFKIIDDFARQSAAAPCPKCGAIDCYDHSTNTPKLYDALAKRLKGPGIEAFFRGPESEEFVLDFVLLEAERENRSPKNIARTIVGMEVEWNVAVSDAWLEKDFNKLLCFNAPLKVFVYTLTYHTYERRRLNFRNSIKQCIQRFSSHRDGERYLIIECYKPSGSPSCREKMQFRIENGEVRDDANP